MSTENNKKSISKGKIAGIVCIIIIVAIGISVWYVQSKKAHENAVSKYNFAAVRINEKNDRYDKMINAGQKLLEDGNPVYDEKVTDQLKEALEAAKDARRSVPKLPAKTSEIIAVTEKMSEPLDYQKVSDQLSEAQEAYYDSAMQQRQITNPSEAFVIKRLEGIKEITKTQAVTEDHDPNGYLNKQGGYTAAVYFLSPLVDKKKLNVRDNADVVEIGTDGGGCVEVYKNAKDAEARNEYLAQYDSAGALGPGAHTVLGTVVIRTSYYLTATQQEKLTKEISDKLLEIEEAAVCEACGF